MICTTIGAMMDTILSAACHSLTHTLYIIYEGDVTFYVGESADAIERLYQHLGLDTFAWGHDSEIQRFIARNQPAARAWQVVLLTELEAVELLESTSGLKLLVDETDATVLHLDEGTWHKRLRLGEKAGRECLECHLIEMLHPCINSRCNDRPAPVPDQYASHFDKGEAWRKVAALLSLDDLDGQRS